MAELILKCEKLNKYFGKKHILKDVSLEVYEGDILAFIGPNGSGKTTTIKLILGLQTINSGIVTINNYDITKNFEGAIDRVGAIVENPDLYMYMSGYKNLKLIANLYDDIPKSKIDEVIDLVGLKSRIHDKVSKYSLGMRQRLGIAQALLHDPKLLILDEPTNGLDPEGIKEMRELLVKLAKTKKIAIFISSHNLSELESFCTKACIIKNGVIVETNTVKEIKKASKDASYIVEVDSTAKLNELNLNVEILNDNEFTIACDKNNIAKLIKDLVMKDIEIYSVKENELSLEEAFLNKTGGNIID